MRLILRHSGVRRGSGPPGAEAACGHAWTLCPVPAPAAAVAGAMTTAVCPACGGSDGIEIDAAAPENGAGDRPRGVGEPRWGPVPLPPD